jgi:hypothetical protein
MNGVHMNTKSNNPIFAVNQKSNPGKMSERNLKSNEGCV